MRRSQEILSRSKAQSEKGCVFRILFFFQTIIITVLVAFIVSNVINFFPLMFSLFAYYDGELKKIAFVINFFGLKIFGGYMEIKDGLVFVHYSRRKAFAIKILDFKPNFFKPKYLGVAKVIEFKARITLKSDEAGIGAYVFGNTVIDLIKPHIAPTLSPEAFAADITLTDEGESSVCFMAALLVNLFGITYVLSMMLWEKIWKLSKKKKTS